jgi:hypothetical protein
MRTAWRSAARCSAGASSATSSSRWLPFLRPTLRTFSITMIDGHPPEIPESAWLGRHDSDGVGPVNTKYAVRSAGQASSDTLARVVRGQAAFARLASRTHVSLRAAWLSVYA